MSVGFETMRHCAHRGEMSCVPGRAAPSFGRLAQNAAWDVPRHGSRRLNGDVIPCVMSVPDSYN